MPSIHHNADTDVLSARHAYQATSHDDCGGADIAHGSMPIEPGPIPVLLQHGDGEERLPVELEPSGHGEQQRRMPIS